MERFWFWKLFSNVTDDDIRESIKKMIKCLWLFKSSFLKLTKPSGRNGSKGAKLTRQHFGNVIGLYLPIYVSNYCTSNCVYCGFQKESYKKKTYEIWRNRTWGTGNS